jgi:hypothetical protein
LLAFIWIILAVVAPWFLSRDTKKHKECECPSCINQKPGVLGALDTTIKPTDPHYSGLHLAGQWAHQAEEYKKALDIEKERTTYYFSMADSAHETLRLLKEKNEALTRELAELTDKYEKVASRPMVFARREIDLTLEELDEQP